MEIDLDTELCSHQDRTDNGNTFSEVAKYKWTGHFECNSYLVVFIIVIIGYSLLLKEKETFMRQKGEMWA